jgi:hypothetical protein
MQDEDIHKFIQKTIYQEVIPTLTLPREELESFAAAVEARFENPYVKHALLAISLNSVSKWRARCMPSLLSYVEQFGMLPACLTFSLAALMAFYSSTEMREGKLIGYRNGEVYRISDDAAVLEFFAPEPVVYAPGIHPAAVVDPTAKIGKNVHIGACAVIDRDAEIGDNTVILPGAYIGEKAKLDHVVVDKYAIIHHVKELKGTDEEPIYVKRKDRI